jgi:5-methylcytosine-specific restriction endonuclease McrA
MVRIGPWPLSLWCLGPTRVKLGDEMAWTTFYRSPVWRKLSRQTKERDKFQCQICGDRHGDPHCQLHAHHRVPRSEGGPDTLENLITLCDLCHAVVTSRWHKPWFCEGAVWGRHVLEEARDNYLWFLLLDPQERASVQVGIWSVFGVHAN